MTYNFIFPIEPNFPIVSALLWNIETTFPNIFPEVQIWTHCQKLPKRLLHLPNGKYQKLLAQKETFFVEVVKLRR